MPNAPQASAPALPPLRSSQAAIDLTVTEEDSGQAYYARHYTHFEWPEGASGATVGIGYDCGIRPLYRSSRIGPASFPTTTSCGLSNAVSWQLRHWTHR
jgi:hypothetical protein